MRAADRLSQDDPAIADEIMSADYYDHDAPNPHVGSEGVKAGVIRFKKAFPDAQIKIAFQLAEGDKVVSRYAWSGPHQGEFVGIPATGRRVNWTATITFRIANGKIRDAWYNMDALGLMRQLGAL